MYSGLLLPGWLSNIYATPCYLESCGPTPYVNLYISTPYGSDGNHFRNPNYSWEAGICRFGRQSFAKLLDSLTVISEINRKIFPYRANGGALALYGL